ncbi:TetR/AcrR family transcriptional regulator [Nocardia altamirensis]|uniref:TetR/AcrR family transcriptional regulator n=1 Tax=Nocardia altamirensis TaxID=472158 RepID=UPI000A01FD0F|nr:TetR/AcrR family transcriptional regulator [Nocardia altamirensis]
MRGGTWGGRTAAERRAERRSRFIDATIGIWREDGWAAVSKRRVCALTGINDRYFYEEFTDLDGLLVAAWESVRDDMLSVIADIYRQSQGERPDVIAHRAAAEIVDKLAADPAYGRILLMHHGGSPRLEVCRSTAVQMTSDLVVIAAQRFLPPDADQKQIRMAAIFGVGGFVELVSAWQSGVFDGTAKDIVDHVDTLVQAFAQTYFKPGSIGEFSMADAANKP